MAALIYLDKLSEDVHDFINFPPTQDIASFEIPLC